MTSGSLTGSSGSRIDVAGCLDFSNSTLYVSPSQDENGNITFTSVSGCLNGPTTVLFTPESGTHCTPLFERFVCPLVVKPSLKVINYLPSTSNSLIVMTAIRCSLPQGEEPLSLTILLAIVIPIAGIALIAAVVLVSVPATRRKIFPFANRQRWQPTDRGPNDSPYARLDED